MSIEIYKEHEDNLLLTFGMLCFGFLMIHVIGKAVAVKVGDLSAANPLISLAYLISTFSTALVLHFNKRLGKRTKAILSIIRWLCAWAFILSFFFFMGALPEPSGEAFLSYGFIEMLSYLLYNISELIISILGFSLYAYLMILPFALWGKINEHF